MFALLGSYCARRWPVVIGLWLAVTGLLLLVAPAWNDVARDGDLDYLPAKMPSVLGRQLMARAFPEQSSKSEIVVILERPNGKLSERDFAVATTVGEALSAIESLPVTEVWTPATPQLGKLLVSPESSNGQACMVVANLDIDFAATKTIEVLAAVESRMTELFEEQGDAAAGLNWSIYGSAAVGGDMLTAAAESVRNTELTTTVTVLIILLLVYRAPLLALVPLVTMGITIVVSTTFIALLTQLNEVPGFEWWGLKVFTTTRIFLIVVLFGSGTDFCLFLLARYREELEHGRGRDSAIIRSLGHVGGALAGSAFTTMVGLGSMFFAEYGKYRNSGPSIAICLGITFVACVTLAPALLAAFGPRVFWPGRLVRSRDHETLDEAVAGAGRFGKIWDRIAQATIRRPGMVLVTAFAVLVPLAFAGAMRSEPTYDILEELGPDRASVAGYRMLNRHFSPGETTPLIVLAHVESGGLDESEAKLWMIALWHDLKDIEGVKSVRCLPRPLGVSPFASSTDRRREPIPEDGLTRVRARYLSQSPELFGKVARFDVILEYSSFSREAIEVFERIEQRLAAISAGKVSVTPADRGKDQGGSDDRASQAPARPQSLVPWHVADFYYGGQVAGIRDLVDVTQRDEAKIRMLVVAGVMLVLLVLMGRPVVCAYLIFTVVFTYLVTIGVTELVFRTAYAETFVGLDWKVSVFLFVLLVAIGQDYNVYLVTRVFEEQDRRGPIQGLRFAVVRTGGIITSCGIIMAATFVSMVTGSLRFMVELGFAVCLGVMLDTCVVRPILVPAFLALRLRIGNALGRDWT
jgi:putative drug exporter of the RND superfamily